MQLVITATSTVTDLAKGLAEGTAFVHSVRETDGSLRRRHFLAGTVRDEAEWVRLQRTGQEADEAEGIPFVAARSMQSIAKELHVSIAAVRRILIDLAITEEVEDMEADELESLLQGADSE